MKLLFVLLFAFSLMADKTELSVGEKENCSDGRSPEEECRCLYGGTADLKIRGSGSGSNPDDESGASET